MLDPVCDVAIVGGGGMGAATAYFLARLGDRRLRVTVIEPDPTYARASTALAAGGIRQQFSTPENILMSQFSYGFLGAIGDILSVGDERPDIDLRPTPYLRLVGPDGREALEQQFRLQRSFGAGSTLLGPAELGERFPWMRLDGVAAGVLGGAGEGLFDPYSMLQAFRRKGADMGVRYHRAAAVGIQTRVRRVTAVELSDGTTLRCGKLVNAAGPCAAKVAAMARLELPVQPAKAHSFAFRAGRRLDDCPVILDQASGLQLKPEGALYVGAVPSAERPVPPACEDFEPDPDLFEREVWPKLADRVPQFSTLKLVRAWVGHVERNLFDGNPILGPHPDLPNFYFVNGFSGHGAQHVPAAGRAIAELIVFGAYRGIDLSRFGYERVLAGRPVAERV